MRAATFWIGFIIGFLGISYALSLPADESVEAILLAYFAGAFGGTLVWKALNDA